VIQLESTSGRLRFDNSFPAWHIDLGSPGTTARVVRATAEFAGDALSLWCLEFPDMRTAKIINTSKNRHEPHEAAMTAKQGGIESLKSGALP
jgi:hypothetical protein